MCSAYFPRASPGINAAYSSHAMRMRTEKVQREKACMYAVERVKTSVQYILKHLCSFPDFKVGFLPTTKVEG